MYAYVHVEEIYDSVLHSLVNYTNYEHHCFKIGLP